jgi:hypothetical protein
MPSNGVYSRAGDHKGQPWYKKKDGTKELLFFDGKHWKCGGTDTGPAQDAGWVYSQLAADASGSLPTGDWVKAKCFQSEQSRAYQGGGDAARVSTVVL